MIAGNSIGDEGAVKISEALMVNTTLTDLDMRSEEKRHKGTLNYLTRIWYFWWTENNIGDEGAIKISEALVCNTALTMLNLKCKVEQNKHYTNNKRALF